ncbi:MAG: isoprenylcysteine carboxylmethyltransferase family protein [Bryobacterales bacterium]|nr:isoprenylcysteine carboxylmethyltransferase family protein [Bryobacterales bacterium]
MSLTALAWLLFAAFLGVFYISHREVKMRAVANAPERRVRREHVSDTGMALQFVGMLLVLAWPGPQRPSLMLPALLLAGMAMGLARAALRHLGRQWRVTAVVTDDHELITTGPYGFVRHPVYTAWLLMLTAVAILRGPVWVGPLAACVFAAGTEIRVRAEERLLRATFGERFAAYVRATRWAYLPPLR